MTMIGGYMKGAVPIRTLVFTIIVGLLFTYAYVGWIGSYQINNNVTMNSTLKAQYEAVVGNGTGIFSTSNLSSQASTQGTQFGSSASLNSLGAAAQFLQSIPAMYTLVAQLTIGSLSHTLGINLNPFEDNILLLITLIIVIAILSAVFLFPL
jgi:hypothetical protein